MPENKQQIALMQEKEDWRNVAGTEAGQRIFSSILRQAGSVYSCSLGATPEQTAYMAGQKDMANRIIINLTLYSPDTVATILQKGVTENVTGTEPI